MITLTEKVEDIKVQDQNGNVLFEESVLSLFFLYTEVQDRMGTYDPKSGESLTAYLNRQYDELTSELNTRYHVDFQRETVYLIYQEVLDTVEELKKNATENGSLTDSELPPHD